MKKQVKNQKEIIKKVRPKSNFDTYYTISTWETKEIDGITFIAVVKNDPIKIKDQKKHWMRKDNLEYFVYGKN